MPYVDEFTAEERLDEIRRIFRAMRESYARGEMGDSNWWIVDLAVVLGPDEEDAS